MKGTFYELTAGTGTSYRRRLYEPLGSGEDDEEFDDVEEQHFMPAGCIFMSFPSEQDFFEKRGELLHIPDDVNGRAMDLVAPGRGVERGDSRGARGLFRQRRRERPR